MRVALVFDMEGTSHIGRVEETVPNFAEYWRSGRSKLTDDVVAAATGLLDGGATEVVVFSHHGAGAVAWPNLLADRLPVGARLEQGMEDFEIEQVADAMFQVGVHARGGDPSFMSHTSLPGFRARLDGELLSESHLWAWAAGLPVLGMVGSVELGRSRGSLDGVPYLGVQHSTDRAHARPVHADATATADAIRAFASAAFREARHQPPAAPPGPVHLEVSMQLGDDVATDMAAAGFARLDRTSFVIERPTWRADDEAIYRAIDAATGLAWTPYDFWFDGLDPSSEATAMAFPPEQQARSTAMSHAWVADATALWFDPEAPDAPYEGFGVLDRSSG